MPKILMLLLVFFVSSCFESNNRAEILPIKKAMYETVDDSAQKEKDDCNPSKEPIGIASPSPSISIPKEWTSKSAVEIYTAITSHHCNVKLTEDTAIFRGVGKGPVNLSVNERINIAKRAALVDAYRISAQGVADIRVVKDVPVNAYLLSYPETRRELGKYIMRGEKISETRIDEETIEVELRFKNFYTTISETIAANLQK